jgi:glycosyltransferase involved in cell wall biosynthesis
LGWDVTVYCRKGNSDWPEDVYKGVKLVTLPTIKHKYLDTVAHTFVSSLHAMFGPYDVLYYCNAINSVFLLLPRLAGKKVVINVDGLEWRRAKWNNIGKAAYRLSERIATWFAHHIISDSRAIQQYYLDKFRRETTFISYGAYARPLARSLDMVREYGLEDRGYVLYVSRLEPENNAHVLIEAYEKCSSRLPLAIVGSAPYGKPYIEKLKSTKDPRIKFLGPVYGDGYVALQKHAYLYVHGNEVGGTNPALLEGLAYGNCVVVNGVPFNREVIGTAGEWFEPGSAASLAAKLDELTSDEEKVRRFRKLAVERIAAEYSWEKIVGQYEEFFGKIVSGA